MPSVDWKNLTPAETHLVECAAKGEKADLIAAFPGARNRVIRSCVFHDLCLGRYSGYPVDPKGIALQGAVFEDEMGLRDIDLRFGIEFYRCRFRSGLDVNGASMRYLHLLGCYVRGTLTAYGLRTQANVALTTLPAAPGAPMRRFIAFGSVEFNGAKIGGQFDCDGGLFKGTGDRCLFAQNIDVGRDVFLRAGFVADGPVDFARAKVGGQFACEGGKFKGTGRKCLFLERISIELDLFLRDTDASTFEAWGPVHLLGATIHGSVRCPSGTLGRADAKGQVLNLRDATVARLFQWSPSCVHGSDTDAIVLNNAHVGTLDVAQSAVATKEQQRKFSLSGLTYNSIVGPLAEDECMLARWVERADGGGCLPQPYEQLAKVLRAQGDPEAAREIAIAKRVHWRRTYRERWGWRGRLREWGEILLLDWPVRYGYKPMHAFLCALVIVLLATGLFDAAYRHDVMQPVGSDSIAVVRSEKAGPIEVIVVPPRPGRTDAASVPRTAERAVDLRDEPGMRRLKLPGHPAFSPFVYSLDVFLPVIDLQQETKWSPDSTRPYVGWWCWFLVWTLTLLGWYLSFLFISAFTGIIKTD